VSDVEQAPQGQAAQAPAGAGQAAGDQGFYSFQFPDGKEKVEAKSKEDLDKYFREHYFRNKDYTTKTQTLAQFRKQVEQEREEMKKAKEDLERKAREYSDYDWMVKNRPDVYKQLQKFASAPPSPEVGFERAQSYVDEQSEALKKELEDIRAQLAEQELQRQRGELMGRLRTEFPDYPEDSVVDEMLEELGSGELEKVLRTLYFAHKGKQNPLQAEKRLAEAQKEKEGIKLMPSAGSAVEPKKKYKNLDEAANAYLGKPTGG
jgi:hypothetical protein